MSPFSFRAFLMSIRRGWEEWTLHNETTLFARIFTKTDCSSNWLDFFWVAALLSLPNIDEHDYCYSNLCLCLLVIVQRIMRSWIVILVPARVIWDCHDIFDSNFFFHLNLGHHVTCKIFHHFFWASKKTLQLGTWTTHRLPKTLSPQRVQKFASVPFRNRQNIPAVQADQIAVAFTPEGTASLGRVASTLIAVKFSQGRSSICSTCKFRFDLSRKHLLAMYKTRFFPKESQSRKKTIDVQVVFLHFRYRSAKTVVSFNDFRLRGSWNTNHRQVISVANFLMWMQTKQCWRSSFRSGGENPWGSGSGVFFCGKGEMEGTSLKAMKSGFKRGMESEIEMFSVWSIFFTYRIKATKGDGRPVESWRLQDHELTTFFGFFYFQNFDFKSVAGSERNRRIFGRIYSRLQFEEIQGPNIWLILSQNLRMLGGSSQLVSV